MLAAVYDLMTVAPHEPADARFTPEEFDLYRRGYEVALLIVLKALEATVARFALRVRTKRLAARQRRGKS